MGASDVIQMGNFQSCQHLILKIEHESRFFTNALKILAYLYFSAITMGPFSDTHLVCTETHLQRHSFSLHAEEHMERMVETTPRSRESNGTPLQSSCLENPMDGGAWWAAVHGVSKSRTWLSNFTFTFHFHALEKEMATHSSVLAWRIPGTGKPGGLLSMGSHRIGHDWSDLAAAAAHPGV